jgi:hypothetical protein
MTRYQKGSLEQVIRNIVLDTLRESFLMAHTPEVTANEGVSVGGSLQPKRKKRRRSAVKGRVTDPNTDKRLKQNRQKSEK